MWLAGDGEAHLDSASEQTEQLLTALGGEEHWEYKGSGGVEHVLITRLSVMVWPIGYYCSGSGSSDLIVQVLLHSRKSNKLIPNYSKKLIMDAFLQ